MLELWAKSLENKQFHFIKKIREENQDCELDNLRNGQYLEAIIVRRNTNSTLDAVNYRTYDVTNEMDISKNPRVNCHR